MYSWKELIHSEGICLHIYLCMGAHIIVHPKPVVLAFWLG